MKSSAVKELTRPCSQYNVDQTFIFLANMSINLSYFECVYLFNLAFDYKTKHIHFPASLCFLDLYEDYL